MITPTFSPKRAIIKIMSVLTGYQYTTDPNFIIQLRLLQSVNYQQFNIFKYN